MPGSRTEPGSIKSGSKLLICGTLLLNNYLFFNSEFIQRIFKIRMIVYAADVCQNYFVRICADGASSMNGEMKSFMSSMNKDNNNAAKLLSR